LDAVSFSLLQPGKTGENIAQIGNKLTVSVFQHKTRQKLLGLPPSKIPGSVHLQSLVPSEFSQQPPAVLIILTYVNATN